LDFGSTETCHVRFRSRYLEEGNTLFLVSSSQPDVVVVGAGPAGTAAAITLARSGRAVTVIDKATFPRDKCCGDGLTTGCLRRLHTLGLDPADVPSWQDVQDVRVASTSGRTVTFPLPRNQGRFAAVARRTDLDHALVRLARRAGVTVLEGHSFTGVVQDGSSVHVDVEGVGTITAPFAVAADGMWSPMRKALAGPVTGGPTDPYLGEWHAYRQYFSNVHTAASRDLWVWFEPDLLPGYAWCFPLPDGTVNVGFGIERTADVATKTMKATWASLLDRPHIRAVLGPDPQAEDAPKAWPIPCGIEHAVLSKGRTLFVGDAALAGDVLTGEGIGQALQTGMAAARAILVGGENPTLVTETYESDIRSEFGPDTKMSRALTKLLHSDLVCRGAIRLSGSTAWTSTNFARWLFEDYPRGIAFTPKRWHRGALSGRGAYEHFTPPVEAPQAAVTGARR
jgi:menaquinone-9 beta-reductase